MVNFYIYYNTHIHTYIYIYIYIYLFINIKNSGKPETVHRYWPVSEIYCTGTTSGTVLTPLRERHQWVLKFTMKKGIPLKAHYQLQIGHPIHSKQFKKKKKKTKKKQKKQKKQKSKTKNEDAKSNIGGRISENIRSFFPK